MEEASKRKREKRETRETQLVPMMLRQDWPFRAPPILWFADLPLLQVVKVDFVVGYYIDCMLCYG